MRLAGPVIAAAVAIQPQRIIKADARTLSVPMNQPINTSIMAMFTRRANPQDKTITILDFATVKALISTMIAITIQSHPSKK